MTPEERSSQERRPSRIDRMLRLGRPIWRGLAIMVVGYGVVALFVLAFVFVEERWSGTLSRWEAFLFAGLVAVPAALPFVWDRLTKLKLFDLEVELRSVNARATLALPETLQTDDPYQTFESTLPDEIVEKVTTAIQHTKGSKLVIVDLQTGKAWWVTRLFVLAALLMDYTGVRTILFLSAEEERKRSFVGMSSPAQVRRSLGADFPILEQAYRQARVDLLAQSPHDDLKAELQRLLFAFGQQLLQLKPRHVRESTQSVESILRHPDRVEWVTPFMARRFLDADPAVQSIEWDKGPPSPLFYYRILDRTYPFVALTKSGHLPKDGVVVDRQALATRIAAEALKQQL